MENFIELQNEIIHFLCHEKPYMATYLGINGYDTYLGNFDSESLISNDKIREAFISRLLELNTTDLALNLKIDYDILLNKLEADLRINSEIKPFYRNPSVYSEYSLMSIYYLVLRNEHKFESKVLAIIERLKAFPDLFSSAKKNLSLNIPKIPKVWSQIALETTNSGIKFLDSLKDILNFDLLSDKLKNELNKYLESANQSMKSYIDFLENSVIPLASGNYATGKELFDFLLQKNFHLPYSADEIVQIGQEILEETELLMYETAKQINPDKSWKDILEDLDKDVLPHYRLMDFYQNEVNSIKNYLLENDLLTVPEEDTLSVIDTPEFERNKIPYAAYIPPAPFGKENKGFFWVTPGDSERPEQNSYFATIVAVHEAYPGHHLQFVVTNKNPSKTRKFFYDNSYVEGWALYWEENMYLNGYYGDNLKLRLLQLRNKVWRACRVIIDVKLHSGEMSFEQAVDMLIDKAALEKVNAVGELKRYTLSPTQPLSYIIGHYEILRLKEDLRKIERDDFKLKKFHDSILECGAISLPLVRKILI